MARGGDVMDRGFSLKLRLAEAIYTSPERDIKILEFHIYPVCTAVFFLYMQYVCLPAAAGWGVCLRLFLQLFRC